MSKSKTQTKPATDIIWKRHDGYEEEGKEAFLEKREPDFSKVKRYP